MAYQSSVMLERQFFKAFFAALVKRGFTVIDWRSDETDARFMRVYQYLHAKRDQGTNIVRLVDRLRPDPISGSNRALDTNLVHMQPGIVRAPNPEYEGVQLSGALVNANRITEALPDDIRGIIDGAADAFIGRPSPTEIVSD